MKKRRQPYLSLEKLEARDCPALSVYYSLGNLTVRGVPNGSLLVQGKTATSDVFHVTDEGNEIGYFAIPGNLSVDLSSRPNHLAVDLNGLTLTGNLSVNLGFGYTGTQATYSVDIYSTISGGTIAGNVSLAGGNGSDTWDLGGSDTDGGVPNPQYYPLTIAGNVTATGRIAGGGQRGTSLNLFASSAVRGNITMNQIDSVSLGPEVNGSFGATTIGGSVTAASPGSGARLDVNIQANVGGNVSLVGTNLDDTFTFSQQEANVGGTIGGNLSYVGGNSPDGKNFFLDSPAVVYGSVSFTDGNNGGILGANGDILSLDGNVLGNVNLNLGNGVENLDFTQTQAGGVPIGGTIGGNFNVVAGNGDNVFGNSILGGPLTGIVGGSMNLDLGNGANTVAVSGSTNGGAFPFTVGGTLSMELGNGSNNVSVVDNTGATPTNPIGLDVQFGNGAANLFTIGAGTTKGNLRGKIGWGVPTAFAPGVNGFVDNGYVWANYITLLNVPS